MIIDLPRFIAEEKPFWTELETLLKHLEHRPNDAMSVEQARRFHYLYQRTSSDLAKLTTFASEPSLRAYLESLVGRAYAEVHEVRRRGAVVSVWRWFVVTFPQTFRRHVRAFWLSFATLMIGAVLGAVLVHLDPEAKRVLLPFDHLMGDPKERVAWEQDQAQLRGAHPKATFSSALMTNNTKVSITAMALGMSWGIGTLVVLFYNGVILGAVVLDYVVAGETMFLLGWLLPHGAIELPAIMIGGQAGLVVGSTLIGRGSRLTLAARFRAVMPDLVTLIGGVAVLLIWAGIIEAFLSQYHEPVIPYAVKIAFGVVELGLLMWFLSRCGKDTPSTTGEVTRG